MTPERHKKISRVARNRQRDLAVVLENIHDVHNIGAILRSCDAVGIQEVHIVYTDAHLEFKRVKATATPAAGALKWLDLYYHSSTESCLESLSSRFKQILVSSVSPSAQALYQYELCGGTAFIFGNEHLGVSNAFCSQATGTFFIPQVGMVQSLNVSVACAVTLYEAYRQRKRASLYPRPDCSSEFLDHMLRKHESSDT